MTDKTRNWPSREEWARNRTTVFGGDENPRPATRELSAYATDVEIAAAIVAMKAMLAVARRQERAIEDSLGPLGRQRGERDRTYQKRFFQMSHEERDAVIHAPAPCPYPHDVRNILRQLQDNTLSPLWVGMRVPLPSPLDAIMARYEAAARAAEARWHEKVAATPIDDAAWERELEWRRKQDDDAAHPERFIHHV